MTVLTENIKKPKGIDPRRDRVEAGPWWWRDENGARRRQGEPARPIVGQLARQDAMACVSKMCCNIDTWVCDHLLREAWSGPLGVLPEWGV
jgi:hypothetical protein